MFKRESVTFAREVLVIAYYFNKEGVPSSFLPELEEREGGREGESVWGRCVMCACVWCVCALLELEKQMFKGDRQEAVLTNESIFD